MSACGYKRTFTHTVIYVRFTPESGHKRRVRLMSANDPKRTFQRIRKRQPSCKRDLGEGPRYPNGTFMLLPLPTTIWGVWLRLSGPWQRLEPAVP